jgi:hypothetical protein
LLGSFSLGHLTCGYQHLSHECGFSSIDVATVKKRNTQKMSVNVDVQIEFATVGSIVKSPIPPSPTHRTTILS